MLPVRGFAVFLCATAALSAQSAPKQLTARELFYAAAKAPDAPKAPTTPKAAPKADPPKSTSKSAPPRSTKTPPVPVEIARADAQEGGVKVIPTASHTAPMPANGEQPLGLRINVLRYNADGSTIDVLPQTVFHSGDRIQLRVEPNARGFLYIASQGASGEWRALFPSAEIANGDNRAEAMHPYVIPPDNVEAGRPRVFTFDTSAGKEKLFVVFSRRPVTDFEELIYKLKNGGKAADPAPKVNSDKTLIMAANIGDSTIGRMRSAARDLIVETVNDAPAPAGEKKDTAIYVVNPSGSSDSSVVADIHLVHQ